jgi:hypothetical protein
MSTGQRCDKAAGYHDGPCFDDPDVCGHWCCKVAYWQGQGGLRLSSEIVPHVRERDARHAPRESNNSWEAGLVGEHRRGGDFMPLLDKDCLPMRQGEVQHLGGSRYVEERLRRTKDPAANGVPA